MNVISVDLAQGDFTDAIAQAVKVLKFGGTVVYPTDTLYALGANALDEFGIKKVFNTKQRSFSKPLPILARNMMWVEHLAHVTPRNKQLLEKLWRSGSSAVGTYSKVTVILPKKDIIPGVLTSGQSTVGIRVTPFPFVDQLLHALGYPIVSTSANLSGEESSRDIEDIIETFSYETIKPSLIIDAGPLPQSEPSTILDLTGVQPKILRIGPSTPEQLLRLLEL